MAALSTIVALSAIAASAFSAGSALTQKSPKAPSMPLIPPTPSADDQSQAIESALSRKKASGYGAGADASGRGSTLLTGPAGSSTAAPTAGKTLLGA